MEVHDKPPVVKYYKNRLMHNMTFTSEGLDRCRVEYMSYAKGHLRTGQMNESELKAAKLLYAHTKYEPRNYSSL